MESNQDQTNKPYLQLDIRTCQPQQVNSSCKERSEDPTSGKGVVSAASRDVIQYLQLETVLYKQQPSKHYQQLDIRTDQPQRVDTSRQESSDDRTSREELVSTKQSPQWLIVPNQQQTSKPYPHLDIRTYQPQQVDTSHQESSDDQTSKEEIDRTINREDPQWMFVPNQQQHSKPYPQLDIRTYQLQQVDNSYQESSDDATSRKELDHTLNKVKLCKAYHTLVQLKDKHVGEAAESVVLWKWFFIKCDPQLGILSKMKSHMAGGNLMTIGLKIDPVNLQRVDISERRVTSADPDAMVTCKLDYVEESHLGSKFVMPGSAYSSTVEDTLQVVNTTYNCDTEPVLTTVVQYEIEIHTFEPSTKLDFLCFSHWFSAITFLLLISANCVRDESCREKLAPISPRGPKFLAQTEFCVHRWRFCNRLNWALFSKSLIDR